MNTKRYFRAIGQQLASVVNESVAIRPKHYVSLPDWAREQIAAGYVSQLVFAARKVRP